MYRPVNIYYSYQIQTFIGVLIKTLKSVPFFLPNKLITFGVMLLVFHLNWGRNMLASSCKDFDLVVRPNKHKGFHLSL